LGGRIQQMNERPVLGSGQGAENDPLSVISSVVLPSSTSHLPRDGNAQDIPQHRLLIQHR
jgi:hypothetical protein